MLRCPAILFLVAANAAASAAEVLRYDGSARDADSGALLYRETHYLQQTAERIEQRVVLYRCPDTDAAFARKMVRYGLRAEQPDFELIDARLGYREGLRRNADRSASTFVQLNRGSNENRQLLSANQAFVADAGFDEFLKQHWDALQSDAAVRLEFLVPAQLATIGFKIRKHREQRVGKRDASVIRLSLGAWWGFIAPHIDAAYDQQTRTLLRYEGLSNLRDGEGRNLNVQVEFPPEARRRTSLSALRQASQTALVQSCEKLQET